MALWVVIFSYLCILTGGIFLLAAFLDYRKKHTRSGIRKVDMRGSKKSMLAEDILESRLIFKMILQLTLDDYVAKKDKRPIIHLIH